MVAEVLALAPVIALLIFSSSPSGLWLVLFAAAGAAGGVYLFFRGFRMLRFKRLILNTPLSRIHSASIGLVEVTGTPVGPYVLTAPITGDPCYYYRVRAWQWVESDNKHQWKSVLDESLYVPFFLEDSTGRVLVDSAGADLDVHKSFSDEVDYSIFLTPGLCPPNVRDFLAKRGLVPSEKIKLEERIIPQEFPLFVFGTLGENQTSNSWSARPHSGPAATVSFGSPGGGSVHFNFRTTVRTNVPASTAPAVAKVVSHIPGVQVETRQFQVSKSSSPAAVADRAADLVNQSGAPAASGVPSGAAKASSCKSRFGDFDLHPSVAISKGERNEPFAISGHSQRELVGSLAWKSVACIWGGPMLTLICLYFLKVYFQWVL